MSRNKFELRVGLFVLVGLMLLVYLLILFSKGLSFSPTTTLHLHAQSAGILKIHAPVEMSGVPVGSISKIQLAPDGKSVTIFLKIERKYEIRRDARFVIEQSGFLGDQYVSIIPTDNGGPLLEDGDNVAAEPPFDLQEVARSASKFIREITATASNLNVHITTTASNLNQMIDDIHREALNENTLTNLANSVTALNKFSQEALGTVDNLNVLVKTNAEPISAAVQNLQAATVTLTNMLAEVQAGRGTVGTLLKNDQMAANLQGLAANLNTVSSNLNRYGIWHMLWMKNVSATNTTTAGKRGH